MPSPCNQQMMSLDPATLIDLFHQLTFNFQNVFCRLDQSKPVGNATDMGVNGKCGDSETFGKFHVGSLSADAGQVHQLFARLWNFAIETFDQISCAPDQILGLIVIQSDRFDVFFNFARICPSQISRRRICFKKCRRCLIDGNIGCLCA